jgi:hypothetical protein
MDIQINSCFDILTIPGGGQLAAKILTIPDECWKIQFFKQEKFEFLNPCNLQKMAFPKHYFKSKTIKK